MVRTWRGGGDEHLVVGLGGIAVVFELDKRVAVIGERNGRSEQVERKASERESERAVESE